MLALQERTSAPLFRSTTKVLLLNQQGKVTFGVMKPELTYDIKKRL